MKSTFILLLSTSVLNLCAQVNPISLGTASSAIESPVNNLPILTQQNKIVANDNLNLVTFIHRQDINVWGGGGPEKGKFRYDISIDNGQSFQNDIGALQTTYSRYGQMPQISAMNPVWNMIPYQASLVWTGSTLDPTPSTDGLVTGFCDVSISSPVTTTENYMYQGSSLSHQGGLCPGKTGEFWMAEHKHDGFQFLDTLYLHKGVYDGGNQDIDWEIYQRIRIPYNTMIDGTNYTIIPNMAFSPDGMKGWCVFLGDLTGGLDSVYTVIYVKTTDGGITWSNPTEIDLSQFTNITSHFPPLYGGQKPGFDRDFDITVDINGNLHVFGHILPIGEYVKYGNFPLNFIPWHAMVDITTDNGGNTWIAEEISTAYTFSVGFPTLSSGNILMQLQPQISRTEDGTYVFYSWVDSDTAVDLNGIGYGVQENLAPNLRIEGMEVATKAKLGIKSITNGDLVWEGKAYYPTMAPTIIRTANRFELPIVLLEMLLGNIEETCHYWYFGKEAYFNDPTVGVEIEQAIPSMTLSPNPNTDYLNIKAETNVEQMNVEIFSTEGYLLLSKQFNHVSAAEMNISTLPSGVYLANIRTNTSETRTFKFVKI